MCAKSQMSGLPDNGVESLFQDDGGRIWAFTANGAAYFENGRFIPVTTNRTNVDNESPTPTTRHHGVRIGRARRAGAFHNWGQFRESLDKRPASGPFSFAVGQVWSTGSLGLRWDERTGLRLYSLVPCPAVYGLDFRRVAWRISKTARSANRMQASMA